MKNQLKNQARLFLPSLAVLFLLFNLTGCAPITMVGAAQENDLARIKQLMDEGAGVEEADRNGMTALHIAAGDGRIEIARFLLDKGAKTNVKDRTGWTPLHGAAGFGHTDIVQLLIDYGAEPNPKDSSGYTPYDLALLYRHKETAKLLRKYGGGLKTR